MTNHCAPFYRQSLLWFPKWRAVLIGTEASGDGEAVEMPTMLTAWSISRGRSMGPDGSKSDCWSCNGNSPVWQFLLAGVSCCHIPLVVAATLLIAGEAGSPAPMWTQRLPKGQYQQQFRPYWLQTGCKMSKNEGILRPTDWISVLPYGVNFNPAHLIKTSWRLLYFEFDIFPARSMIVFVVVGRQLRRFWYPYSAGATEMVPTCPNHMIVAVAVSQTNHSGLLERVWRPALVWEPLGMPWPALILEPLYRYAQPVKTHRGTIQIVGSKDLAQVSLYGFCLTKNAISMIVKTVHVSMCMSIFV